MQNKVDVLKRKVSFYLRKKVTKKYVIFESDDWGLERAKNSTALQTIIDKYDKNKISRWTTDALESVEDLDMIFNLFDVFKNKFENNPVLTANFITHNIDYTSPAVLKFKPITDGYNFGDNNLFFKYKEGFEKNYFTPQLHGFSHYNTDILEKNFQSNDFQEDFKNGFPLAKSTIKGNLGLYRGECFDPNFEQTFKAAATVFKEVFGYYSKTFIPPNFLYTDKQNAILYKNHIELLQSSAHFVTQKGNRTIHPFFRVHKKLQYSVRGGRLDTHPDYNFLAPHCIKQIETMFLRKMPAIIDVHRVNFAGTYSPETRQKTIEELYKVLVYLHKNHPDVIFLSSDGLLEVLKNK